MTNKHPKTGARSTSNSPNRSLEWITLLAVLILAAYLRLANNGLTPGWYTDEGTHLEIARHWAQGRVQYLAINQSTLLFAKLPLFEFILTALIRLHGVKITTLRTLTGLLGLLSVGTLYATVRCTQKDIHALARKAVHRVIIADLGADPSHALHYLTKVDPYISLIYMDAHLTTAAYLAYHMCRPNDRL